MSETIDQSWQRGADDARAQPSLRFDCTSATGKQAAAVSIKSPGPVLHMQTVKDKGGSHYATMSKVLAVSGAEFSASIPNSSQVF
ncbi:MAG: hypothetical protein M1818_003750 [Claussenomyces sp. TS43310]|nr:MAG: hypothetical protein M1818_003750 [Claussenomyces sp. TS43310]